VYPVVGFEVSFNKIFSLTLKLELIPLSLSVKMVLYSTKILLHSPASTKDQDKVPELNFQDAQ
jgi:hypothetical protein